MGLREGGQRGRQDPPKLATAPPPPRTHVNATADAGTVFVAVAKAALVALTQDVHHHLAGLLQGTEWGVFLGRGGWILGGGGGGVFFGEQRSLTWTL